VRKVAPVHNFTDSDVRRDCLLKREGDEACGFIATEDHRGEAACDDREKKAGCVGCGGVEGECEAGTRSLGKSNGWIPFPLGATRVTDLGGPVSILTVAPQPAHCVPDHRHLRFPWSAWPRPSGRN
jgi:hypothetical protein